MSFIKDNEYVILMDYPASAPLDDLKRLTEVGVQTTLWKVDWDKIEVTAGVRDFSAVDTYVENIRKAGMKTLLMAYHNAPGWCPDEWYLQYPQGLVKGHPFQAFSWWNPEAQDYADEFTRYICARYNAEDVMCICGHLHDGEFLLPYINVTHHDPLCRRDFFSRYGDEPAVAHPSYREWIVGWALKMMEHWQGMFAVHPAKDLWISLHPILETWGLHCACFVDPTLDMLYEKFPDYQINTIRYTHYPWPSSAEMGRVTMAKYPKLHLFGGTQFVEGIVGAAMMAVQDGGRLLCAPIHPDCGNPAYGAWMFKRFAEARKIMGRG